MITRDLLFACSWVVAGICCVAEAWGIDPTSERASAWKRIAGSPIEITLAVKNSEDERTLYVGQPILLNVGIQNVLARELSSVPEAERQALQTQGVAVARSSVTLCDQSRSWVSFIKVFIGPDEDNAVWSGNLSGATSRVLRINQVDMNPVSVAEYVLPSDVREEGQNQIWAVFDNTSLDAKADPELLRFRAKSNVVALRMVDPTNEHQNAWVLAEEGRMCKMGRQLDAAESLFRLAIRKDPLLGRGPRVGASRMFDLNWELAEVYETMGRYSDAVEAATRTREYVGRLPPSAREEAVRHIDARLARLRERDRTEENKGKSVDQ